MSAFTELAEAALDQPHPTPALVTALNRVLAVLTHRLALKAGV